jgi:DNA invertase Pin-like site-specific DNA recombinase
VPSKANESTTVSSNGNRAALYLRVSRDGQTLENQRIRLLEIAERRSLAVVAEYQDEAISGAAGRDKRPGFDRMMRDGGRRRFDVLLVWHVDRLGRSTSTVALALDDLHAAGVNYVDNNGLDTTTPTGKAMFGMSAVFAELERSLIRERVLAGLERARRQGKQLGRPRTSPKVEAAIRARLTAGEAVKKVAKALGVGNGTVARVKQAMTA